MKYHIGCSGYYYPQWKNKFYPAGVTPKNWLAYYSSVFNTVELNGTFYRKPKLSDLKKYAQLTPEDFTFAVKMSRYITHVQRLKEKQSILDFQELVRQGLNSKVSCFLFQMPPSFHCTDENMERIINNVPHTHQSVVELRHLSWWNTKVKEGFENAGITFCNVDFPGLETYFIHTSPIFYLRLHGNPELFVSSYNKEQLEGFYKRFPDNADLYKIYFNNTAQEAGYKNALQLMDIVKTRV